MGQEPSPDRNARRLDILRHFPTLLNRWRGADARIKELTVSHRTLGIELYRKGVKGFLRIACIDPLFIHAPLEWTDADLRVELHGSEDWVVLDARADVRVITGSVEISETV
ncbi:MAG: hypothetical protein KIS92_17840 [Planctomycetota bacterium]|nr:hypothetical protein [Planctomycetota bacterium]